MPRRRQHAKSVEGKHFGSKIENRLLLRAFSSSE